MVWASDVNSKIIIYNLLGFRRSPIFVGLLKLKSKFKTVILNAIEINGKRNTKAQRDFYLLMFVSKAMF